MNMKVLSAIPLIVTALLLSSCGKSVTRVEVDSTQDLSGKWNDTDSRLVAEEMIADAMEFPWARDFKDEHGRKPFVKLGKVTVRSNGDVIETDIFLKDIRRSFMRTGQADIVSSNQEVQQNRAEKEDQDMYASEETRKEAFQETGTDFLLVGTILVQDDKEDRTTVKFYSVDLELSDVKTNKIVWQGNKKIKKVVKLSKHR